MRYGDRLSSHNCSENLRFSMGENLESICDFERLLRINRDRGGNSPLVDRICGEPRATAELESTCDRLDADAEIAPIPWTIGAAAIADPQQKRWEYGCVPVEPVRDT